MIIKSVLGVAIMLCSSKWLSNLTVQGYLTFGADDPGFCDTIGSTMDFRYTALKKALLLGGTTRSETLLRGVSTPKCTSSPVPFVLSWNIDDDTFRW